MLQHLFFQFFYDVYKSISCFLKIIMQCSHGAPVRLVFAFQCSKSQKHHKFSGIFQSRSSYSAASKNVSGLFEDSTLNLNLAHL